ncbi:F-box/kelch-repeat protein At3g23880-like [Solanum stenotomum]|uniref:F-box/kelch-repeat protein At3g23880-like n=1 Tax=Solanum stenotomum TaxID=172797 RepID=UPI0020D01359|nr:F-box/kelch-repeat protein At3g23880-like [Solanum stenotomum]
MGSHEEIIIDILSRLSVKSLLRFKCVSKSWNTLISEPYFIKKHLNTHAKNQNSQKLLITQVPHGKYCNGFNLYSSSLSSSKLVEDIRRLDYPSSCKPIDGRVYCCCDGLFFIGFWIYWNDEEVEPSILLLWNPSTRESIMLPSHVEIPPQEEYVYGLGYDATSDDYKILRIDTHDKVPDEILALKSGSWRQIEETSDRMSSTKISDRELCLAFLHGAFHWLGHCPRDSVVSFNISDEMYGEIPLPGILSSPGLVEVDAYALGPVQIGVSVLGGKLSLYHKHGNFDIWVLKDYGVKESWTKWFTIPSYEVVRKKVIIPIYRFSDDEVLLSYFCLDGMVYRMHNVSLESSNRIWPLDCNHDIHASSIQDGFVYTESLISPRSLKLM